MAWSVDRLVGFLSEIHALKIDLYLHQQGLSYPLHFENDTRFCHESEYAQSSLV
jgi:hypothetical protein